MSTIIHMSMDIIGALRRMENQRAKTKSCFFNDDGTQATVGQARIFLYEELSKGRKVLPVGECDNFCYEKGCLGHQK